MCNFSLVVMCKRVITCFFVEMCCEFNCIYMPISLYHHLTCLFFIEYIRVHSPSVIYDHFTIIMPYFALNLCILGNFACFCCRLLIFFKINFFEKFFPEYHQSVKQFGSRSGPTFCRA